MSAGSGRRGRPAFVTFRADSVVWMKRMGRVHTNQFVPDVSHLRSRKVCFTVVKKGLGSVKVQVVHTNGLNHLLGDKTFVHLP